MATIVQFEVDSSGITRLIREAERAEKLERSRAQKLTEAKTKQKEALTLQEKQVIALRKEYAERQKNIAALDKLKRRSEATRLKEKRALERAQSQEARRQATAQRQQFAAQKKSFEDSRKFMRGDLTPMFEKMGKRGAVLDKAFTIGKGVVLGLGAAAGIIAKMSIDAAKARRNSEGMISVLSGDAAGLAKIDRLAENLGISIEKTRERFIDFRKNGLSNIESVALIKTLADVRAKWGEATESAAMDKFFKNLSEGHKHADALTAIRDQLGVLGDGSEAAAAIQISAMDKLENRWLRYSETLGHGGESILVTLGNWGLDALEALENFGGKLGSATYKLFYNMIPVWKQAGIDLVKGFGSGIASGAKAAVDRVAGLADNVVKRFKNVLGIRSPSIVFEKIGSDTIEGLNKGVEKKGRTSPEFVSDVADSMIAAPALRANNPTDRGSPGGSMSVTIENINVSGSGDPESTARSIRREIEIMLESLMIQRGMA